MTLLNELNVGSQQYGMMGVVPMGTCATPAGTAIKESAFAYDFELSAGNLISVTFTYANTYGDGSTTYPSLKIGSYTYPIKYPTGAYASSGAWANGQAVTFMFDGVNLIMTHPVATAVQAGNNLPVSSDAVAEALNKINYSSTSRDIDTLYPNEDGKIEAYGGSFSGNVPELRAAAVLKACRIKSTASEEVHLYQEWEGYGASSPYNPNKYFRFGYFTGSMTVTWTDWQKIQKEIKSKSVKIPNITIGADGSVDIRSYNPGGMNNFMFALLRGWGTVSTKDAIAIGTNAGWLWGTAGAVCTNVEIYYYYTD